MIKIKRIVNSVLDENTYIIYNDGKCLIVDPGSDTKKIINQINTDCFDVKAILITHYHFDHVSSLEDLKKEYPSACVIDYNSNKKQKIDDFEFTINKNYGHTLDSVSYYFDEDGILFTGDFLFKESIGNYEYENESLMIDSLSNLKKYPINTIIYPGHYDNSTLSHEFKCNPFLRGF